MKFDAPISAMRSTLICTKILISLEFYSGSFSAECTKISDLFFKMTCIDTLLINLFIYFYSVKCTVEKFTSSELYEFNATGK